MIIFINSNNNNNNKSNDNNFEELCEKVLNVAECVPRRQEKTRYFKKL